MDEMDYEDEGRDAKGDAWLERVSSLPEAADVVPEQWEQIRTAIEPRMRRRSAGPWWVQIAAAVTLLAGGLAGGFAAGQRHADAPRTSIDEAMELAAEVQRTGSEYVAALAAFTAVVDSLSDDVRLQGRDAAIATLVGAATELAALTDSELAVSPVAGPATDGRVRF